MKKEDIIVKGLLPYFKDKRNRSITKEVGCVYNSPNGKHCFAGHFLKPEYKKLGDDYEYTGRGYDEVPSNHFYKYFNALGSYLIHDLQYLHDDDRWWKSRKITWERLEKICNDYKLDFKYIKSQLIEKCRKS